MLRTLHAPRPPETMASASVGGPPCRPTRRRPPSPVARRRSVPRERERRDRAGLCRPAPRGERRDDAAASSATAPMNPEQHALPAYTGTRGDEPAAVHAQRGCSQSRDPRPTFGGDARREIAAHGRAANSSLTFRVHRTAAICGQRRPRRSRRRVVRRERLVLRETALAPGARLRSSDAGQDRPPRSYTTTGSAEAAARRGRPDRRRFARHRATHLPSRCSTKTR